MQSKSNNKYDVFIWIKRIIDSAETKKHYLASDRLIQNFYNLYGDFKLVLKLRFYLIRNKWS